MRKILQTLFLFSFITVACAVHAQDNSNVISTQIDQTTLYAYSDSVSGKYYLSQYGSLWEIVKNNDGSMELNYYGNGPKDIVFSPKEVKRLIERDTVSYFINVTKGKATQVIQYYLPPGKDVAQKTLFR